MRINLCLIFFVRFIILRFLHSPAMLLYRDIIMLSLNKYPYCVISFDSENGNENKKLLLAIDDEYYS